MSNNLNRYLTGELTPEEKMKFLQEAADDDGLREELVEYHSLLALVGWLGPKSDREAARKKLAEFMHRVGADKNR